MTLLVTLCVALCYILVDALNGPNKVQSEFTFEWQAGLPLGLIFGQDIHQLGLRQQKWNTVHLKSLT